MKTIFADPTPRWVPFTAAAMIVAGVWVASVWESFEFAFATKFAVGLACVLFVLIFFHGRFYWKGQVDRIVGDGAHYEARTSIWVGRGRTIAFAPQEATGWRASPRTTSKGGAPDELGTIYFTAQGRELELSFVNPRLVDVEGLTALNPAFFAKVKADYPGWKPVA